MKKKLLLIIALCLSFTLIFTACGNKEQTETSTTETSEKAESTETADKEKDVEKTKEETEEPKEAEESEELVEIEFWHGLSGENGEVLESIVNKFNEANENYKVNLVFQGHYKDLFEKLSASSQTGEMPALSMIFGNRLTAYIMNDMVEPLDSYVEDSEIGFDQDVCNDIPEGLRNIGLWGGVRYSLPFNKSVFMLYYNADEFEAKGIEVPTTWEELRAAAEQLTYDDKVGLIFNQNLGIDFSFWVEQAGGHIYDETTDEVLIDSPETKKAYEFVTGMIADGIAQVADEEGYITGPMARGEAFMGFASSSNLPHMKEACEETGVNWAVAALPSGDKSAASFSGTDITMFNTVDENQKKAAFEFMKFWYETENQVEWGKGSGYLPLTNSAFNDPEFQKFLDEEDGSKRVALDMFPFAFADPKVLNGYAIHSNMQQAIEEIIAGTKTIDEALTQAQERAVQEMEEAAKNVSN